jgi:SAM-dependent methyltransferase
MIPKLAKIAARRLAAFLPSFSYQKNKGYCPCCESQTSFISLSHWFRDNYHCIKCLSIPRERALMLAIKKHYPDWMQLSIHESSPNDSGASRALKTHCKEYLASQFFPGKPLGETIAGFSNQDLEHQTFEDETFDLVVTQDVFEHIFDPAAAFREINRTLKAGGAHIFAVPIINRFNKTETWAEKDEQGNIRFLGTPEIHGNPVDEKGSPVTMHWGFDIVDFIRTATKMDTEIEDIYDLNFGLSARYLEIFVSKKTNR